MDASKFIGKGAPLANMEDVNLMEWVGLRCIVNTLKTPIKQITNMLLNVGEIA